MERLKRAWHDGTTHLLFEPLEFLEKLAALTPRPEINLVLYHGVLAPHARWRPEVVAYRRAERTEAAEPSEMGISIWMRDSGAERPRHWTWAALMRRAFDLDVLRCPRCAGRMHLIATIDEPGGHSADPRSSRAAGRTGRPAAPVFGIDGAGQAAGAPLRKPVAKQVGPWTHAGVEVCPASAWQPEVDSSRPVRRAADLTFPTRSGRIGATWRLLSALCQGNLRGAMSENGSYVVYALGAKGLRGHEPSTS